MARVGLVLVSHSAKLAEGLADLVRQMAPEVAIEPAGGMDDGGLGTSYDLVAATLARLRAAGGESGVVVLTDLGSAVLTVESVLDMEDLTQDVLMADAPFVEGAVAAGVAAQGGATMQQVRDAAEAAAQTFAQSPAPAGSTDEVLPAAASDGVVRATVVLRNRLGLHARPAALLARLAAGFDAQVTVNEVNAASVLELMTLGAVGGQELRVEAVGSQAKAALDAVVSEIESGFGET
jgi:PTS hybrid protein